MYLTRRFTLPAHGAIEFLVGMVMMIAPIFLGFGAAGLVISAFLGSILAGTALTLNAADRGPAIAFHSQFDSLFAVVMALAALGLAIAGQASAAIFLAALVAAQAALYFTTRYAAAG
jgi:hypothetical protein